MIRIKKSLLAQWGRTMFVNTFIEIYQYFVRARAPFRYCVPRNARTDATVERIRKTLLNCRAPLDDFVVAQFNAFDEDFCRLTFKRDWPPLTVFHGAKAVARYDRWHAWRKRAAASDERARRRHTARLERSATVWRTIEETAPGPLVRDLIRLAVKNGSVTGDYVVLRVRQGRLSRGEGFALFELVDDENAAVYRQQIREAALEAQTFREKRDAAGRT